MAFDQGGGDVEPGDLVEGLDGLDDTQGAFQHHDGDAVVSLGDGGGVSENGGLGEVTGQRSSTWDDEPWAVATVISTPTSSSWAPGSAACTHCGG